MPATGGFTPGPERYGGGEGNSNVPLLQRVFESLSSQRGSAYDQTLNSAVGVENMAIARAITFDGYGCNQRLANQFLPSRMTANGLLPRWERIFGLSPAPTDDEPTRRARVASAWMSFATTNTLQPMIDAVKAVLGPLYVGIVHQTPANALTYAPWLTQYPGEPGALYSTIAHVNIQVTQLPDGYHVNDIYRTPNAAFYAKVGQIAPIMDAMLPAWATWDWFILSVSGRTGFYLDEPDLDLEEFDI